MRDLVQIEITRDDRGNTVVRILDDQYDIHDTALFVSPADALEWASKFIPDLEPSP